MKKKIIISALLLVLLVSLVSLNVSKVSAYSEEEDEQLYYSYEEFYTYPYQLRSELLEMRSAVVEDSVLIRNFVNSDSCYISSYVAYVGSLDISFTITCLTYQVLYFSLPNFERGYYIDLTSLDIDMRIIHNNYVYTGYSATIPIDNNWEMGVDASPYIYLGVDKTNIENGTLPIALNQTIDNYITCSLDVALEVYLVEVDDVPSFEFGLEVDYLGYYHTYARVLSVDNILNLPINFRPYVDDMEISGLSVVNNLVPPPIYFTYLQHSYSESYDVGYSDGYDVGYSDGYGKGQSSLDIDFTDWISTAVNGFLSFELMPGLSLISIVSFIIALGLLFLVLRFFSGG